MSYVIGTPLSYIRVYEANLVSEKEEKNVVFKVEHGLNLTENPTIFNDKELANQTLQNILEQKDNIKFENKNIFDSVINGDTLDVSKLKVYQMFLFDANEDIVQQMKELLGNK